MCSETVLNAEQVRALLKKAVAEAGGQKNMAERSGLHQGVISDIIRGKRPVGTTVPRVLGLEQVWRKRA